MLFCQGLYFIQQSFDRQQVQGLKRKMQNKNNFEPRNVFFYSFTFFKSKIIKEKNQYFFKSKIIKEKPICLYNECSFTRKLNLRVLVGKFLMNLIVSKRNHL